MLKDFFMNVSLLISSFFLVSHLFKRHLAHDQSSVRTRILYGLLLGAVGIVLMVYTIHVAPDVVVDLRHLVVVMAAIYGGPVAALVSGCMIALGRIGLFGISPAAVKAASLMMLIGVACGLLTLLKWRAWQKFFAMNFVAMLIVSLALYLNLKQQDQLLLVYANHWAASFVGGALAFYMVRYITASYHLYRKLKASEYQYRLIAENMSDLLAVLDPQGVVQYASPSHQTLLGLDPQAYRGQQPIRYIHPDDVEPVRQAFHGMFDEGTPMIIEFRWKHQNGQWVTLDMRCKPVIGEAGEIVSVVVVSRDITIQKETEQKLREANETLQNLTHLDGLTGVANRRCFDERIQEEWRRAERLKTPLSLIFFDIDCFKSYNDTYGHQRGDRCLQEVAITAKGISKRQSDLIARYGGEEFAVILPQTDETGARHVAEQIRHAIETKAIPHSGSQVGEVVTVSLGVCTIQPDRLSNPEQLIAGADYAMYQAKSAGRNRVFVFRESNNQHRPV